MASAANPTLLDRFLTFINPQQQTSLSTSSPLLVRQRDYSLLAVSGGLDSVVMAHLFHSVGFRFAIAHVNFGLRDNESDDDALFVENIARQFNVPFHTTRFATADFADKSGISIQMAARTLRYDWFEQVRIENEYTCIATAHHRNDVLETLLLNLTRGTGLAGLHGIAPRQGALIRPLLFADRADLETYAADHRLDWREDRSNKDDHYARNRIRHHVVPILQSINPNLLQTLNATIERLRAAETLVQHELDRTAASVVKTVSQVTRIDLFSLHSLSEPAFRLSEWLRPYGYTYQQAQAIWLAVAQGQGQEFRSATHRLIHERNQLILSALSPATDTEYNPIIFTEFPDHAVAISDTQQLTFQEFDKPIDFVSPSDPLVANFDADRLTFPILIRRWKAGDRFRPLGLNGHKLVSDLLTDQKVSRLEREQTLVLLSEDRIAWVIGKRIDHRFRITDQTQRIIQVRQVAG